jgi:hypothetical protein
MEIEFPYLKITRDLRSIVGPPDKDTRTFRTNGPDSLQTWMEHLRAELQGNLIPLQWVPDFVGVSRAAVHKRVKQGKLTVFVYEISDYLSAFGKTWTKRRGEVAYCVLSECQAWFDEIVLRAARQGPPELLN